MVVCDSAGGWDSGLESPENPQECLRYTADGRRRGLGVLVGWLALCLSYSSWTRRLQLKAFCEAREFAGEGFQSDCIGRGGF